MSDSSKRRIKCGNCNKRQAQFYSYFNNLMIFCKNCRGELHSGSIPWEIDKTLIPKIKEKMLEKWKNGERNIQSIHNPPCNLIKELERYYE